MSEQELKASDIERPVVVLGVGRSGTSLVHSMLHAHPEIVLLPETHFFRQYVGPVLSRMWIDVRGARHFKQVLERDRYFCRAGIETGNLLAPFFSGKMDFTVAAAHRRLLVCYLEKYLPDKKSDAPVRVGFKDPRLIDFLPALGNVYPKATVVHIIRDPRDVLVSRRKAEWSRGRSDLSHIFAYRLQMGRGRRTGTRVFGDQYLELRYEDLLAAPRVALKRVCAHVDIPFRERMLHFTDSAEELVAEDERAWKKETTNPLDQNNTGNWEGEVDAGTLELVERFCVRAFPDLGYVQSGCATEPAEIGFRTRFLGRMLDAVTPLLSTLYPLRTLAG